MKSILSLLILGLIFSCSNSSEKAITNEILIIDFQSVKPFTKQDNINTITYIPLQTREDILMKRVSRIVFRNGRYYIEDSHVIFIFNQVGSLHQKLKRQGKGPGEYLFINSFDLNPENGSLWIYDNNSRKILIYDSLLENYEEVKLDQYFEEFAVKSGQEIFVKNLYSNGRIHERMKNKNYSM